MVQLVFEQVLLFTISVAIFIACFSIFNSYQSYFLSSSVEDQINGVRDLVISNILEVVKFEEIDSSIKVDIPKVIGDEPYVIELSSNGINITTSLSKISVASSIYELNESFNFQGKVFSSKGKFIIYKTGNNIILQ